ncbi:YceI family protein [Aquimarina sp. AU119]|uniref:YceI family protein n=1 Tax=Aquimarina sp. AU119 TaxID=2108528 RepID=UPI000D69EA9A|nr:YceI family protein [Aquimarina sp. AU119]
MKVTHKKYIKNFIALLMISLLVIVTSCGNNTDDNKRMITTSSGLQYKILKEGSGGVVQKGQEIHIHETTKYTNGSLVFSSRNLTNPIKILVGGNQVIKGLDEGILGMKVGEVRKLIVPPELSKRMGNITFPHPDSTLVYEVELIDIVQKNKFVAENKVFIDTVASTINWRGFYALKTGDHFGTIKLKEGEFYTENNRIIGGEFYIDMNSIVNTDGKYNEMLVDHLKNSDFFEVHVYPISKLKIIGIEYITTSKVNITANLTIKGIKQPVNFIAEIENKNNQTILKSKFSINRTRWDINHASGRFHIHLTDQMISDDIEFDVVLYSETGKSSC